MYLTKTTFKQGQPLFYAGLILVIAGAVTVLLTKPERGEEHGARAGRIDCSRCSACAIGRRQNGGSCHPQARGHDGRGRIQSRQPGGDRRVYRHDGPVLGPYGPILHKGQVLMGGSRLRPFICVGFAYFLVAVLVPLALLPLIEKNAALTFSGSIWSLGAGTAGALGSLGIILAFNFGGRPIYVMPLVFGGAPVINTLTSIAMTKNLEAPKPVFYAGLIVVLAGAVTVLIFAPKTGGPSQRQKSGRLSATRRREINLSRHRQSFRFRLSPFRFSANVSSRSHAPRRRPDEPRLDGADVSQALGRSRGER